MRRITGLFRLNDFRKNTLLSAWSSGINAAGVWLLSVSVARFLGFEDAGVWSIATSFTAGLSAVAAFGGDFQISDVERRYSEGTFLLIRFAACALSLLVFFASLPFVNFSAYITISTLIFLFYRFSELTSNVISMPLRFARRYDIIAISSTIKAVFCFLLPVLAMMFFKLPAVFFCMFFIHAATTFLYDFPNAKKKAVWKNKIQRELLPPLVKKCLPFIPANLCSLFIVFYPRYVINARFSTEELGFFASATVFLPFISYIIAPLITVVSPEMTEFYFRGDMKNLKRVIIKVFSVILAVSTAVFFVSMAAAKPLLVFMYGKKIISFAYLMPLSMLVAAATIAFGFSSCVLVSFQNAEKTIWGSMACSMTSALLSIPMIERWGLAGSCYLWILIYIIGMIINLFFIFKITGKIKYGVRQ
ncbi:MAG: hypothetical protein LBC77_00275 [Spirochaetaceae bacterium]|jgi:O-antigen/teichoic acid export membrane protein|nr:hypothetical protein [Spirochaetaceae bacterium]